jgi:hypothetical protein
MRGMAAGVPDTAKDAPRLAAATARWPPAAQVWR